MLAVQPMSSGMAHFALKCNTTNCACLSAAWTDVLVSPFNSITERSETVFYLVYKHIHITALQSEHCNHNCNKSIVTALQREHCNHTATSAIDSHCNKRIHTHTHTYIHTHTHKHTCRNIHHSHGHGHGIFILATHPNVHTNFVCIIHFEYGICVIYFKHTVLLNFFEFFMPYLSQRPKSWVIFSHIAFSVSANLLIQCTFFSSSIG